MCVENSKTTGTLISNDDKGRKNMAGSIDFVDVPNQRFKERRHDHCRKKNVILET